MSLAEFREQCNRKLTALPKDAFILLVLLLTAVGSFGLGYLSGEEAGQGSVSFDLPAASAATSDTAAYVASQNGTRYYPVSCALAARIGNANKVYFATEAVARAAGYQPAQGCEN